MGTLRLYTKQALSIFEQIELLKSRGLNIADSPKAAKFLGEVSYFRFVQYLRPMEADKTTHPFKPNSRFEDAVALYNFDIELRELIFKAVQRLEIALRTKMGSEGHCPAGIFKKIISNVTINEEAGHGPVHVPRGAHLYKGLATLPYKM